MNLACKYDLKSLKAAATEKIVLNKTTVLKRLRRTKNDEDVGTLIPDVPLLARELFGLTA